MTTPYRLATKENDAKDFISVNGLSELSWKMAALTIKS